MTAQASASHIHAAAAAAAAGAGAAAEDCQATSQERHHLQMNLTRRNVECRYHRKTRLKSVLSVNFPEQRRRCAAGKRNLCESDLLLRRQGKYAKSLTPVSLRVCRQRRCHCSHPDCHASRVLENCLEGGLSFACDIDGFAGHSDSQRQAGTPVPARMAVKLRLWHHALVELPPRTVRNELA